MGRKKGQLTPEDWLSGPDPADHRLFNDCQRARAQAWYRGQDWFITEQQYIEIWRKDDRYLRKGRANDQLCMTRIDPDLPWTIDNIEIKTRLEHYKNTNNFRGRVTYGPRKYQRRSHAES